MGIKTIRLESRMDTRVLAETASVVLNSNEVHRRIFYIY